MPGSSLLHRFAKTGLELRASFWLRPLGLLGAGVLMGVVVPLVEDHLAPSGARALLGASPRGARALLSVAAGTLATTLTIALSMTMVTVQLAASQYSSRVVGRFLSNRTTQYTVGAFLATIAFLFLVLRSVRSPDEGGDFVPAVATTFGLAFTLGCLALLVLFVHATMRSVQAATIIAGIGVETIRILEGARRGAEVRTSRPAVRPSMVVSAPHAGYVRLVQPEVLLRAGGPGLRVVVLEVVPGEFRTAGEPLATVELAAPAADPAALEAQMRDAFVLGRERTMEGDPLYGIRQLVDIALRALSPAVNDPTTAIMVIHELAAVLRAAFRQELWINGWSLERHDRCVVVRRQHGFSVYLTEAFGELTRLGREQPRVATALIEALARVLDAAPPQPEDRAARDLCAERAALLHALASAYPLDPAEREALEHALQRLRSQRERESLRRDVIGAVSASSSM